ncbi:2-hydroxyacid dehydrogenase [Ralstonia sp. UBA689]|uniref:2-hydroxyacid dehydrogenase n=1 Tax=Ralstonia sp. UBA689 TaxID=1947373 RepID=UPI0025E565FD|nr:2-hydroxyacid dehydrogenase [Ralstonia sp. UBA689]
MHPTLLILIAMTPDNVAQIGQHFHVIHAPTRAERDTTIARDGHNVRIVLTNGSTGLTAAEIAAMPKLELACALGAGYENIDVQAARARGVVVANGAGTNDACVADHAIGLLLATVRGIPKLDRITRDGVWRDDIPLPPGVSGKRLGIVGLGTIGQQIARRAAGFDMQIGYHNRAPREGVPYRYFNVLKDMAEWADFLIVATPGGAQTRHLINHTILEALGPHGYVVNIARGSVVDTVALEAAIRAGKLGGAGLDVYESEPKPPAGLLDLEQVVLTPHVAGWSPESVQATVDRFLENARRHLAGEAVVSPV